LINGCTVCFEDNEVIWGGFDYCLCWMVELFEYYLHLFLICIILWHSLELFHLLFSRRFQSEEEQVFLLNTSLDIVLKVLFHPLHFELYTSDIRWHWTMDIFLHFLHFTSLNIGMQIYLYLRMVSNYAVRFVGLAKNSNVDL